MLYEEFINDIANEVKFDFFDGTDTWSFKDHTPLVIGNKKFISIAESESNCLLALDPNEGIEKSVVLFIEEDEWNFFALSLMELFHRKELIKINKKISRNRNLDFETYLQDYKACYGCLYWIASGIYTSVFDGKKHSPERNKKVIPILSAIGAIGDPRACNDLASYYTMEEESPEMVLKWKLKSLLWGDNLDKRKVADFILEERHDHIDLAVKLLEEMRASNYSVPWTYWQEANIYLKGINVEKDLPKGLKLLKAAVDMDYALAMADYSYFLHNGIGIKQNKAAALEMLERANVLNDNRYADILETLRGQ
jgi:hypothetical protein